MLGRQRQARESADAASTLKMMQRSQGFGMRFLRGFLRPEFPAVCLSQSSNYNGTVWGKVTVTLTGFKPCVAKLDSAAASASKDLAPKQRQGGKNEAAEPARDRILSA